MGSTGCLQHEEGSSCKPCRWSNKAPTRQTHPLSARRLCFAQPILSIPIAGFRKWQRETAGAKVLSCPHGTSSPRCSSSEPPELFQA